VAVSVAEYLGQRTDIVSPIIHPVTEKSGAVCPFMDRTCDKVAKGNPPVCSVRKNDGTIWIVCEHRLCATRKKKKVDSPGSPGSQVDQSIGLIKHQQDILWQVAQTIYRGAFSKADIGVRREVAIPLPEADVNYHADFIMRNFAVGSKVDEILLEMQGGGETSSTGAITRHLRAWSSNAMRSNALLAESVSANPIETNAWRRQQEQFLVKGNVVNQTGGRIVFAVGELLYDYLQRRFEHANLRDLRTHNWTLCILTFVEDSSVSPCQGPIPLIIDDNRTLFTNYSTFVRFLTDQGGPCTEIFEGEFLALDGTTHII
jgi:hypothetical protein